MRYAITLAVSLLAVSPAMAAEATAPLGLAWGLPFAGILLSIALLPAMAPDFWHRHVGTIAAGWSLALLLPYGAAFGAGQAASLALHAALFEYIPFIALIGALYVVAGGIALRGNLHGCPTTNTALLATGTALASIVGTTGASILLIRPLLRANDDRIHKTHVFVLFIFLVSNIGGALSPLGDPPLFLGFLNGVPFFWPTRNMLAPMLLLSGLLLAGFYFYDRSMYAREGHLPVDPTPDTRGPLRLEGKRNLWLLAAIIAVILAAGTLPSLGNANILGQSLPVNSALRDAALVAIAWLSLMITPLAPRRANRFGWGPLTEVALLFAGIFITIAPVIAMLKAGAAGPLAGMLALLAGPDGAPNPQAYFWLTGLLTSFLDNAPTYLVFFHAAGGDAEQLTGPLAQTLLAISMGAVFMGANTYIGNAPNFMVRAIAADGGVEMPGFFGFMAWSAIILLPAFVLIAAIFL